MSNLNNFFNKIYINKRPAISMYGILKIVYFSAITHEKYGWRGKKYGCDRVF